MTNKRKYDYNDLAQNKGISLKLIIKNRAHIRLGEPFKVPLFWAVLCVPFLFEGGSMKNTVEKLKYGQIVNIGLHHLGDVCLEIYYPLPDSEETIKIYLSKTETDMISKMGNYLNG